MFISFVLPFQRRNSLAIQKGRKYTFRKGENEEMTKRCMKTHFVIEGHAWARGSNASRVTFKLLHGQLHFLLMILYCSCNSQYFLKITCALCKTDGMTIFGDNYVCIENKNDVICVDQKYSCSVSHRRPPLISG